jgi:transposase-like protein
VSRGQPPKLADKELQAQVLRLLLAGQSVSKAAEQVGVTRATVYNTAGRDPEFGRAMEKAMVLAKRRRPERCPTCGAPRLESGTGAKGRAAMYALAAPDPAAVAKAG